MLNSLERENMYNDIVNDNQITSCFQKEDGTGIILKERLLYKKELIDIIDRKYSSIEERQCAKDIIMNIIFIIPLHNDIINSLDETGCVFFKSVFTAERMMQKMVFMNELIKKEFDIGLNFMVAENLDNVIVEHCDKQLILRIEDENVMEKIKDFYSFAIKEEINTEIFNYVKKEIASYVQEKIKNSADLEINSTVYDTVDVEKRLNEETFVDLYIPFNITVNFDRNRKLMKILTENQELEDWINNDILSLAEKLKLENIVVTKGNAYTQRI